MKAVQIDHYGDNSILKQVEIAIPEVLPNQVLVELKASSVNPVDYKIRSGFFAGQMTKTFPFTLGWEGAGIITEVGQEVTGFAVGDAVIVAPNFMQGGTYAEYVAVNANEVMPKPATISFPEASVLPFSLGTAYVALVEDAQIEAGQKILIHGAGGAVGQMAVQLAKDKGLTVIGTAAGQAIQELNDLGIDQVIDYTTTDFSSEVANLDLVLDLVGGETQMKSYALLKKGGKLISTAQPPNPAELEKFGINGKMTMTHFDDAAFNELTQLIESGSIKLKQPAIVDFSNAAEALALVENRKSKAKIVFEF